MALTKTNASITQVTATGQSGSLAYTTQDATLNVKHVNGTGTITEGAEVQIQTSPDGGTTWYDMGGPFKFGTTASGTETRVADLPIGNNAVRLDYTAPTGSTGHTLDAQIGRAEP